MKTLLTYIAPLVLLPALAHADLPATYLNAARLGPDCQGINLDWEYTTTDALTCWLSHNQQVSGAMEYNSAAGVFSWPWPDDAKQQLFTDFDQMVGWFHAGMPQATIPGFFPNRIPLLGPPDPVWGYRVAPTLGSRAYVAQIATSLAAELTAQYPWSIATYTDAELTQMFAMYQTWDYFSSPTVSEPGYYWSGFNRQSPANPAFITYYFRSNHLIGATAAETIAHLFVWERRLGHDFYVTSGGPPPSMEQIEQWLWGPEAPPIPDIDLIDGTNYTGPDGPIFGHWTLGCTGTQDFMESVLRTVNIPVQNTINSCGHATPVFPSAGVAMTHGDDPYDETGFVTPYPGFPGPEPLENLVTIDEYNNQIFPPGQSYDACIASTGVQPGNIAIKYGSDYVMNLYCQDLASSATHANGQVYAFMSYYYSLQTLESMGLWTTLDNKQAALNWCATH